jgi:hypothetical protein
VDQKNEGCLTKEYCVAVYLFVCKRWFKDIWLSELVRSKQLFMLNAVVCRLCAPMAGVEIDTNPYRIRDP